MVAKKGVIKDVPLDMDLENLRRQINLDNQNKHPAPFYIMDAVRLKMRTKEINVETKVERWVWKESRAVCLTFRTKEMPPYVYFCSMKVEVATFVAAVRQCYNCGKFNHISKFCKKEKQCFSCGEATHEGTCITKCMNCNGDHRANSERCPVIKTQKEINQIMAHRNVGFFEARKIVEKWSSPAFPVGAGSHRGYAELNLRNFPVLKTPSRRKEWDIFESREYNKVPNQTIGWNQERRQWKMNTDSSSSNDFSIAFWPLEQFLCSFLFKPGSVI